jgi:hypothetical protein
METHLIIRGNFIGAAIVAIIYTVYILKNISAFTKSQLIIALILLNALTIVLMSFAFSYVK